MSIPRRRRRQLTSRLRSILSGRKKGRRLTSLKESSALRESEYPIPLPPEKRVESSSPEPPEPAGVVVTTTSTTTTTATTPYSTLVQYEVSVL